MKENNKKRPCLIAFFFAKATAANANKYFYLTKNFLQFKC